MIKMTEILRVSDFTKSGREGVQIVKRYHYYG